MNDAVGGDRGEEKQQITHVGLVENEVHNEVKKIKVTKINRLYIFSFHDNRPLIYNSYVQKLVHKSGQHLITPKVGITFESEKEAYEMYNTYAGKVEFSIRRSKTKHCRDNMSLFKHNHHIAYF